MNDLFVDTAGWGHLVDASQKYHSLAAAIYRRDRQQGRKLYTTNYILTELVALLISPLRIPRITTIEFIESLKTSPFIQIIHVDAVLDERAWQLFKQRDDKNWSLVDCASFVLMRDMGITQVLTTDHHFEQAGFVCLLKTQLSRDFLASTQK
ncbi:MAG: type II toxin-antitoxin system VapC family toxin [Anaerolineae bacterium]|nr:type II toxin-antitoxin system VapC family toxin [Anaerolineae bacterium]